ncbi:MAG TPA: superinfection immunity protein [Acidisarcina sp.]
MLFLIALYFLPAIIAHARHSTSALGITIVNLLFGWTGIGWIATLLWAMFSASWDWDLRYDHTNYYTPRYYTPPSYISRYPKRW